MKKNDLALLFFASTSSILLLVSAPATYAIVSPFHNDGDWFGIILTLATLLAFELGAVGCKLVTLAIPKWSGRMNILTIILLCLTTVANYVNGVDLFLASRLSPTLENIRQHGYAPLVAFVYSATIPTLLYVFLSASVARVKQLQCKPVVSLAEQRDTAILTAVTLLSERLQLTDTQLPQSTQPLAITDNQPSYQCPHCLANLANRGQLGAAMRYGHCSNCKVENN